MYMIVVTGLIMVMMDRLIRLMFIIMIIVASI